MPKPMSASVWHRLQAQLRGSLPPEEFRTWFGPLAVESESESRLVLRAPNQRFISSLEEVYRPMVDRAIARHGHAVVHDGQQVGVVTSGTQTPYLKKAIAMAYVPPALKAPGTELEIDIRGRRAKAVVVPLPFYKRAKK